MREILFRGKYEFGQCWAIGSLVISEDVYGNVQYKIVKKTGVKYIVIPETIGQYTGLTDKNSKKIFEGDIVREYMENIENEYDYHCFDCGRVFWYQQQSQFLRTSKGFPEDCDKITDNREYEVIGNIYDNPELLEKMYN